MRKLFTGSRIDAKAQFQKALAYLENERVVYHNHSAMTLCKNEWSKKPLFNECWDSNDLVDDDL